LHYPWLISSHTLRIIDILGELRVALRVAELFPLPSYRLVRAMLKNLSENLALLALLVLLVGISSTESYYAYFGLSY
jgi:hypothetical protein